MKIWKKEDEMRISILISIYTVPEGVHKIWKHWLQ